MDVIRRNTDYAIRAMAALAENCGNGLLSARKIAEMQDISAQLTSKLLQTLCSADLVESVMGSRGGFRLARDPSKITLNEIVSAVQGRLCVCSCVVDDGFCPRKQDCPVCRRLEQLQSMIDSCMEDITLDEFAVPVKDGKC